MGSDRYLPFLPIILNWIQQTLDAHAHERRAVSSFNFPRLPHYFSEGLLKTASVVPCDRLPVPPLSALGLREFADFESQPARGITYRDTYFLWRADATDESLHFHELVHVVRGRFLAPRISCCCTPLVWPNPDTVIVRSKRWPTTISAGSTLAIRRTQWRRKCGGKPWR